MIDFASGAIPEGYFILPSTILGDGQHLEATVVRENLLLIDFDGLIIPERRLAHEELKEEDTKRPPVNSFPMT